MQKNNIAETLNLDTKILNVEISFIETDSGYEEGLVFETELVCGCGTSWPLQFNFSKTNIEDMIKLIKEVKD